MSDGPQRAALNRLATALNCSPSALRRDGCGDPAIVGKRGHVYAVPDANGFGYWIYHVAGSARAWTNAKKEMAFAELRNDGHDEGAWLLPRLPSPAEAEVIRSRLSISQAGRLVRRRHGAAPRTRPRSIRQSSRRVVKTGR